LEGEVLIGGKYDGCGSIGAGGMAPGDGPKIRSDLDPVAGVAIRRSLERDARGVCWELTNDVAVPLDIAGSSDRARVYTAIPASP
jgi:hypothetical protein